MVEHFGVAEFAPTFPSESGIGLAADQPRVEKKRIFFLRQVVRAANPQEVDLARLVDADQVVCSQAASSRCNSACLQIPALSSGTSFRITTEAPV